MCLKINGVSLAVPDIRPQMLSYRPSRDCTGKDLFQIIAQNFLSTSINYTDKRQCSHLRTG
jgi:hypothetical protein